MNETNKGYIPVAFICDENYALPTTVAITSIKLSRNSTTRYRIHVLGVGLSEDSKKRILAIKANDFDVDIIERSLNDQQAKVVQVRKRVTTAALLKFELPNIFPDLDKLLYLDSDMLIQQDLSELYNINLGEAYAGVVADTITLWGDKHKEWLHFNEKVYFNSGMMLLNLRKMREDALPQRLLDYRLTGINHFMDQDALNVVFGGNMKLVSPKYNLLNFFFSKQSIEDMNTLYQTEFSPCVEFNYINAAILHFGDEKKPWKHYMGFLSELYRGVYNLSPYADKELVLEGDPLNEINRLRNSYSYRIGRAITFIPRKVPRGIKCLQENGIRYTIHHIYEKICQKHNIK